MKNGTSYKDLIVWQKSIELVDLIYDITKDFPKDELFTLSTQMRRASISIPSNIAEGRRWSTKTEYRRFLIMAYGSGAELETQLYILRRRKYIQESRIALPEELLSEVLKMLNKMIYTLKD